MYRALFLENLSKLVPRAQIHLHHLLPRVSYIYTCHLHKIPGICGFKRALATISDDVNHVLLIYFTEKFSVRRLLKGVSRIQYLFFCEIVLILSIKQNASSHALKFYGIHFTVTLLTLWLSQQVWEEKGYYYYFYWSIVLFIVSLEK